MPVGHSLPLQAASRTKNRVPDMAGVKQKNAPAEARAWTDASPAQGTLTESFEAAAQITNGDSPDCPSSNPSPERLDEAHCRESPLEKSIADPAQLPRVLDKQQTHFRYPGIVMTPAGQTALMNASRAEGGPWAAKTGCAE